MKVWVLGLNDQPLGVFRTRAALLVAWMRHESRYAPLTANYWAEEAYTDDAEASLN